MKKIIIYTEDQVKQIVGLLNCVTVSGIQNAKQIAAVAQILDSGTPGEIKEPEGKEKVKDIYSPVDWESQPERKTKIGETSSKKPVPRNWKSVPAEPSEVRTAKNNASLAKAGGEG